MFIAHLVVLMLVLTAIFFAGLAVVFWLGANGYPSPEGVSRETRDIFRQMMYLMQAIAAAIILLAVYMGTR